MKKLSKILLASLATLSLAGGLTACDKKEEQGSNTQEEADTPAENQGTVVSVTVTSPVTSVMIGHDPVQLTATVEVTGNAAQTVTWSSSSTKIAKVSSSGLVTFVGGGTVTITATSTADTTKKGTVSITVDAGPRPELISSGYMYSKTYPFNEAKSFVGKDVVGFESEDGFYWKSAKATSESAAYFQIVTADSDDNYDAFVEAVEKTDYFYFYDADNYLHCFIDQEQTFELDFDEYYLDDDDEDYSIILTFYKTEDIWYSSTPTTDTAWNEKAAGYIAGFNVELPFIKLGEKYDSYYDEEDDYVIIYDACADFNKLNEYGDLLIESGWTEEGSEEEGFYYTKSNGQYTNAVVSFYFGYYGNSIELSNGLKQLESYPATEVSTFVSSFSVRTVPEHTWPEAATFTYEKGLTEDETDYVGVGIYGVGEAELNAFIGELQQGVSETDKFVIVEDSAYQHYYGTSGVKLTNGKIVIEATITYGSRDANEADIAQLMTDYEKYADIETEEQYNALSPEEKAEFDELSMNMLMYYFTGTFTVYEYDVVNYGFIAIYADPSVHEVPGLYVSSSTEKVALGSTFALAVEAFELGENPVITYSVSAEGIISVDENGVITPIAEGTCDVTASTTYNETNYDVVIHVTVVNEVTDTLTLGKLHNGQSIGTTYTDFSGIQDESDAVYAGQCAGGNSAIQIRSSGSNSGIYTTTSGGTIKSVSVTFNSNDTQSSGIKVIASNTALLSLSAIFAADAVATLTKTNPSYEFTEDYAYVAIISASGAHYLDSVEFVWAA